jgi:phospholipase/carboxylesterase
VVIVRRSPILSAVRRTSLLVAVSLFAWACTGSGEPGAPRLEFVEVVTGEADPATPLPLFVGVHGFGDTPERFSTFFSERVAFPARFVFLRAPDAHGDGFSWFPIRQSPLEDGYTAELLESADRIAATARSVAEEFPTLGEPVVFGFSQGGMLSFALAANGGSGFRAAVPIAGFLPEALRSDEVGEPIPVRAYHGADDRLIPAADARATVEYFKSVGAPAEVVVYDDVGHSMSRQMGDDILAALRLLAANPLGSGKPETATE